MQPRRLFSCFAMLALLAAFAAPIAASAQGGPPRDRYIVVLNADAGFPDEIAADIALRTNGQVGYIYEHALQGFSITMPRVALAGVTRDPRVAYVEEDIPVSIFAQTTPTGVQRIFADTNGAIDIDGNDNWRVDVDVAVIDSGIDLGHPDLNVVGGTNCMGFTTKGPLKRFYFCDDAAPFGDDFFHGTHVAGTIGALDNDIGVVGVAPGARLWAVKVLDSTGSGTLAGVIAGIDWVVERGDIEVINMSLGGDGSSRAMNTAVANAVASGVTVVVAAGNDDEDAAGHTPANAPDAITVSALADFDGLPGGLDNTGCRPDEDDTLANFSNWGAVDIVAPGVCILSTYPMGHEKGDYHTISGTSMASPHVAGAAALLASTGDTPADIRSTLLSTGNLVWADDSGDGNQEPLLDVTSFTAILVPTGGGGGGGGNSAPTASFSHDCTGLSCNFDAAASSDSDGNIVSYAWTFGDSTVGSGENPPAHVYSTDGTYPVVLTVTDNDGASDFSAAQQVTVSSGGGGGGNDIYVSAISMSDKDYGKGGNFHDLTTTVVIRRDDDANGADENDVAGSGAFVTIKVTLEDGRFFSATVQTDGAGSASYVLKRVPVGTHVADVTNVTHATYDWNEGLDVEPDEEHQVE